MEKEQVLIARRLYLPAPLNTIVSEPISFKQSFSGVVADVEMLHCYCILFLPTHYFHSLSD